MSKIMRFREWFVLNEMATVVKGDFLFYHGTSTGANNEVLNSFKQHGAQAVGSGWGQGGGFYVFNKLANAQNHALDRKSGEFNIKTSSAGNPMVVVVKAHDIDFANWDLDIERQSPSILGYASKNINKLNKLGAVKISPSSQQYLAQDKDSSDEDLYKPIDFSQIKKHSMGTLSAELPTMTFGLTDPLHPIYDPDYDSANVGDANNLAKFYYAHQDNLPERHKKLEAWFFNRAIQQNKEILLKYTGKEPLPVVQILIHNGQDWVRLPSGPPIGTSEH